MGFHTFPVERADQLDDPARYRFCSLEELVYALDLTPTDTVLDIGAGTGFYTLGVAPHAETTIGLDIQHRMAEHLMDRDDRPPDVSPVVAGTDALPLADGTVDVAFSTMTFHEYSTAQSHTELHRVLRPDGRLVAVDWRRDGTGEDGPSLEERFSLEEAVSQLQGAGFHILRAESRPETYLLTARPR